jgi:endonuclease/exonuclease/phosphatase family metal-dependent hydrolase
MPIDRKSVLALLLGVLASMGIGCTERGTDPPIIESVGPAPLRVPSDVLRIATANLWGVSIFGLDWADDIDERFAAMADRLSANRAMLDIVLIQEAWKDKARRALLKHVGVAREFPFRVDAVDHPGGAGLVILSRFPIEAAHFNRFRSQGRCIKFWEGDCISGKGILVVRLTVGDRSIWVADTHLIACYSDADQSETDCDMQDPNGNDRWRQIVESRRAIESLAGNDPAILGGDFNLTRTSRYYPLMTSNSVPSDPSPSDPTTPVLRTTRSDRGWTEAGEEVVTRNRIDYLWTRPGIDVRWHVQKSIHPIFTEPVVLRSGQRVALSDHPILATEICLVRVDDPRNRCMPFQGDAHARY